MQLLKLNIYNVFRKIIMNFEEEIFKIIDAFQNEALTRKFRVLVKVFVIIDYYFILARYFFIFNKIRVLFKNSKSVSPRRISTSNALSIY